MLPPRKPQKPKRSKRWRSQAHLNWIRGFQCAMHGFSTKCDGATEAAHVRIGSGAGMGQKPDDWRAVPLCKNCHQQQHQTGEHTFWRTYQDATGLTVEILIAALCRRSPKAAEISVERQKDDDAQ